MTKKDFFKIVLRILGLYFLGIVILNNLPNLLILFHASPILSLVLALVVISLYAYIFSLLIFKPDSIIRILKLDQGFDDDAFSAKRIELINVLKVAVITTGLFIIVMHLPTFLTHFLFLFKLVVKNRSGMMDQAEKWLLTDYLGWGIKILNLIIGYLMITNYSAIAQFILKKESVNQSNK